MSEKVGLLDIVKSVLAAFFGVQSGKNRKRDFTHGKPLHFIIAGAILAIVFVLVVWGIVNLFLHYTMQAVH